MKYEALKRELETRRDSLQTRLSRDIARLLSTDQITVERKAKGGTKMIDIRPSIGVQGSL